MTNPTKLKRAEQVALDALTELNANYEWPRLNESTFVNKYLPILTYNFIRPESEHIVVKTEIWVREVSKNPYYNVLIVADNDPSQVLFWVPPVLRTGGIFRQKSGMDSFNEVMATSVNQNSVLPGAGDAHLIVSLEQRLKDNNDLTTDQKQWYLILHRYGILEKAVGIDGFEAPPAAIPVDDTPIFGDVDEW